MSACLALRRLGAASLARGVALRPLAHFPRAPNHGRFFGAGLDFKEAQSAVQTLPAASNEVKLELYALFKQATQGPNTSSKPGAFDFVGKAKWNAWSELGNMSKAEAEAKYVARVQELMAAAGVGKGASGGGSAASTSTSGPAAAATPDLAVSDSPAGVRTVRLNRPSKRNAFSFAMYTGLAEQLRAAAADPAVKVVLVTGTGEYYSAGNDLGNFAQMPPGGPKQLAADAAVVLKGFVGAFIDFPKPLFAAVNGPAIGIAVTLLPFFDAVYASHRATFHTPFASLGLSPEGCSSITFPRIMGPARAYEMLQLERKITAPEAAERGLVTRVVEDSALAAEAGAAAAAAAALPPGALAAGKQLLRAAGIASTAELHATNARECEVLKSRWLSDECMAAVVKFMSRKAPAGKQ